MNVGLAELVYIGSILRLIHVMSNLIDLEFLRQVIKRLWIDSIIRQETLSQSKHCQNFPIRLDMLWLVNLLRYL